MFEPLLTNHFGRRIGLIVLFALTALPAVAQEPAVPRRAGTVVLTDWPDTLAAAADTFEPDAYQLLPKIEALTMEYRYEGNPRGVDLSFVLNWVPGAEGLYDGRVRPYDQLPADLRMVAVELLADVVVDGRDVADVMVAVDSMALPSHPSVYAFEVADLAYETLFLDTPADSARHYVAKGFELRNVTINQIAFSSFEDRPVQEAPEVARNEPPPYPRPRPPRSVYTPRVGIFVGWRIGPDPYYVGPGRTRDGGQPREASVGRSTAETDRSDPSERGERTDGEAAPGGDESTRGDASGRAEQEGRSGKSGRQDEGDGDEDDDEDSLLPASLAAVAVVGAAAVIGGTVGVHGTGRTPLGLVAGRVGARGGGLVQASINTAVLGAEGRQHLEAKLIGFYDVLEGPVQPALGIGAVATAEGDETTVEPSVSLGVVGNLGRVVLMGGYDVVQGVPELGLAINFRFNPDQ